MMKKLIGIALAICMVVPFAAGCGKKRRTTADNHNPGADGGTDRAGSVERKRNHFRL